MAEWGNPGSVKAAYFSVNKIAEESETRGSEPSQYPEEKKSIIEIP